MHSLNQFSIFIFSSSLHFGYAQAHWDKKHSKVSKEIPPEYAMQYLALKEAKKKAQKLKGTSAAGAGKKVKKKKKYIPVA